MRHFKNVRDFSRKRLRELHKTNYAASFTTIPRKATKSAQSNESSKSTSPPFWKRKYLAPPTETFETHEKVISHKK